MRHLISIDDLSVREIEKIFYYAETMRCAIDIGSNILTSLRGKVLACLFYEPSTRTSSSFISAMTRLGGSVIPITQGVQFSSVTKGETLEDTIITLGQYADAIVLRSPNEGDARRAASVSPVPIINAGDGIGEHPTQALLDLFTIQDETKGQKNIEVALVGDLKNGRTVHSLVKLFSKFRPDIRLTLVSPEQLRLPRELFFGRVAALEDVQGPGSYLADSLETADVIYMTRVQKERFTASEEYEAVKDSCVLTADMMQKIQPNAVIMHPLPRVNEIDRSINSDPRAAWFRQVRNGLWVRMAILHGLLT